MAKRVAEGDYRRALDGLQKSMKERDVSLRGLCSMTIDLEIPERVHHSTLSKILNREPDRNMYLEQFMALSRVMGATPEGVLLGNELAARVARDFMALNDKGRAATLKALDRAKGKGKVRPKTKAKPKRTGARP